MTGTARGLAILTFTLFFSVFVFSALLMSQTAVAATCLIDVHGVDVVGSTIKGNIENTGDINASVSYDIWVEKGSTKTLVKNGSLDMLPGQKHVLSHPFNFETGSYIIKLNATADCGASDFEAMGHIILEGFVCARPEAIEGQTRCDYVDREYLECTTSGWQVIDRNVEEYCYNCQTTCGDGACNCGENTTTCRRDCGTGSCSARYLNEYRCLGDYRQRRIVFSDCSSEWRHVEDCIYGCASGECNPGPGQIAGCGVNIKTFDYLSTVTTEGSPYVTMTVQNTGTGTEFMAATLFIDNSAVATQQSTLHAGSEFTRTFSYSPPSAPGSYDIKIRADAGCGSSDTATSTLSVITQGEVVEPPAFVVPDRPQIQTNVDFFPTIIDIKEHGSKVIVVDIDSSMEQEFTLNVEGAPYHWFEYPSSVTVDVEESVYIYMTPEEVGTYELTVTAVAQDEILSFERKIDVFVAPADAAAVDEDTVLGYLVSQIAGFFIFVSQNLVLLMALIIVALLIIIAIGRKHLKTEYEDLLPGSIVSL
jgi:hypothetical protein